MFFDLTKEEMSQEENTWLELKEKTQNLSF